MAVVNFFDILIGMQEVLSAQNNLQGIPITVEEEMIFGVVTGPWIGLYLDDNIDTPDDIQTSSAGQRIRHIVPVDIHCINVAYDLRDSVRASSELVAKVLGHLMKNRGLNRDYINTSFLRNISFTDFKFTETREDWLRSAVLSWHVEALTTNP